MLKYIKKIYTRLQSHDLFARSAEASYYLFLSFFPFLMLLVTVLSLTGLLDIFLERKMDFLPSEVASFLSEAVLDLKDRDWFTVPFSVVTLLWSASRGVIAVSKALQLIYGTAPKGNYLVRRIKGVAFTLMMGVFIVLSLVSFVFSEHISSLVGMGSSMLTSRLGGLFVFVLLVLFFNIIYMSVRGGRSSPISELGGSIVAGTLWVAFSYAYSYYIDSFSKTSVVYGSAAAVVLLLLWLNFCILFLLIGAELNNVTLPCEITIIKK